MQRLFLGCQLLPLLRAHLAQRRGAVELGADKDDHDAFGAAQLLLDVVEPLLRALK